MEYTPVGPVLSTVKALKIAEDVLMFWIPLLGASVMILLLVLRILAVVAKKLLARFNN